MLGHLVAMKASNSHFACSRLVRQVLVGNGSIPGRCPPLWRFSFILFCFSTAAVEGLRNRPVMRLATNTWWLSGGTNDDDRRQSSTLLDTKTNKFPTHLELPYDAPEMECISCCFCLVAAGQNHSRSGRHRHSAASNSLMHQWWPRYKKLVYRLLHVDNVEQAFMVVDAGVAPNPNCWNAREHRQIYKTKP